MREGARGERGRERGERESELSGVGERVREKETERMVRISELRAQ